MKKIFEHDIYNKLKKEKAPMYSYSQLTEFHQCELSYWLNRVYGYKGVDKANIYTMIGSLVDGLVEDEYEFGSTNEQMLKKYESGFIEATKKYNFVTQKNYVETYTSCKDYIANYTRDTNMIDMKTFVALPLGDYLPDLEGSFFFGECDFIVRNEEGKVCIGDFKTSTVFKGKDLIDKAVQLVLYSIAYEYCFGEKVDKIFFDFIKYTPYYEAPYLRTEKPNQKEKYYKYVELTDEIKEYALEFLLNTIMLIKAKDKHHSDWNANNSNTFFCNNLCAYKGGCFNVLDTLTK